MVELVGSEINFSRVGKIKSINDSSKEEILDIFSKRDLLEKGKYSKIKHRPDDEESKKMNKELILEIKKIEEEKMQKSYEDNRIDNKYLIYAQNYINDKLKKDGITNKDICKIMQLLKRERFLIVTNKNKQGEDRYLQFEITKNQWEKYGVKGNKIINRHIDNEVDLPRITECILEGKREIIDKIDKYKDIKFIHSCSRLGDKDFINRREKERQGKPSRIINLFKQEENYSKYLGTKSRESGFRKKRKFANKEDKLGPIIEKYEQTRKGLFGKHHLGEGERLIDLEKMEKRWKEHTEGQRSQSI